MTKRMLIDATHDEETRVAVLDGDRLDEFDYESKFRKPLKGSIFLAKVTRVEPSLQAAFVNFGGNRHGFLPFSEIHPDYFRIPISDREALLAEQEAALKAHDEEEAEEENEGSAAEDSEELSVDGDVLDENMIEVEDIGHGDVTEIGGDETHLHVVPDGEDEYLEEENGPNGNVKELSDESDSEDGENVQNQNRRPPRRNGRNRLGGRGRGGRMPQRARRTEAYGEEDDIGDGAQPDQRFRFNLRRKYKIQEVIKRGQIMLVQVSKEERGNKGAAVGSYLSLPGRYCVLMPNSPRAGGVSRKIASYKDRARMREIMQDLEVPKGMSVILRTAGVTRTKAEIKRDLDYLMRLWDNIRELTLESTAPALVYEEADLIKRSVRDLYTRDVEEIHVAGDEGFRNAKNFMKMMIPSHVKRVHHYKGDVPLFQRYRVEDQISEIGETSVRLKSGGYLIINPTEALISIDVNSGKATKERHIEETALKTNMEAAEEVARQLRLRDLGGLVVIDFIDMEDRRNNAKVERKMRESLSGDRARIQVGRISSFGLMEMSRQRMNPSLTESQFELCVHCQGMGRTRTADAASIMLLRAIEDEGAKARAEQVIAHVSSAVALYILNNKRKNLSEIEERYNFSVVLRVDDSLGAVPYRIEVSKPIQKEGDEPDEAGNHPAAESEQSQDGQDRKGSRRRGRRGGRRRGQREDGDRQAEQDEGQKTAVKEENPLAAKGSDEGTASPSSQSPKASEDIKPPVEKIKPKPESKLEAKAEVVSPEDKKTEEEKKPAKKKAAPRARKTVQARAEDGLSEEKGSIAKSEEKPKKSKRTGSKISNDDTAEKSEDQKAYEIVNAEPKEKKKGWWNR